MIRNHIREEARGFLFLQKGLVHRFGMTVGNWSMLQRCVVYLMKDDSTRRVYRLYEFTKSQIITSDHYYCVSGKVNSADKLYLVIESVRRDTKHSPDPQLRLKWTAREKRP